MKSIAKLGLGIALAGTAWAQGTEPRDWSKSLDHPERQNVALAPTPPMGWNSWNHFQCAVSEQTIRGAADAMVASGMRDAGYQYIVIDDCWHGQRDAHGDIRPDPKLFPHGIKALADYVHSKGLKFGIYTDAGRKTCGDRPGSRGHEYQDALQYANWGVDYLKEDWCNTDKQNAEASYTTMRDALNTAGRPIVLSICEWGSNQPWLWGERAGGNLWRTTGDIGDYWIGSKNGQLGVVDIIDRNEPLYAFAGPGHWNDPDMLEVGNGHMTAEEYRSHFSLWAMMAAPLMAGNDLTNMSAETRSTLTNRDIIAIDQDKLGRQGRRIRKEGDLEVWSKELSGGGRAVLMLNRGSSPANITANWVELGYPASLAMNVHDAWSGKDQAGVRGSTTAQVAPHGVVVLTLRSE